MNIRLLDTGLLSGARNMALDGIILEEVAAGASPPTFRFLRFDPPAALVGYNQAVDVEIRAEYCAEKGIDINRRHTGGGSILFTPDMLGFELFWPLSKPGPAGLSGDFSSLAAGLGRISARAMAALGVEAAFRPRNDIEVQGKKISGTGLAFVSGGWMFQGTLLMDNCLEDMLRALRVPVEKLKRKEIRSLLQRVTFLADELKSKPDMDRIKAAFVEVFSRELDLTMTPAGLTPAEQARLDREIGHYSSPAWIHRKRLEAGSGRKVEDVTNLLRSQSGRLRVALVADLKRRQIKQALISGDFFSRPQRLALDLEAYLRGVSLKPEPLGKAIDEFFAQDPGEFAGVETAELRQAIVDAATKGASPWPGFSVEELNRIHPIAVSLNLENWPRPSHLLLPYCAKDLSCEVRHVDDCTGCGLCNIGDMYTLAEKLDLAPISISSFEHLMSVLEGLATIPGSSYVASCCEAFLAKHMHQMAEVGLPGMIVDLASLTCYDLGKESQAYEGRYNRQSSLDGALLAKTATFLAGRGRVQGQGEGHADQAA